MKIYMLPADENWICDTLTNDWLKHNPKSSVMRPEQADIIWIFSEWRWRVIPKHLLKDKPNKKVVVTIHHLVPSKFGVDEREEFMDRDKHVDLYHVYNARAKAQLEILTDKPVRQVPYWVNDAMWRRTADSQVLRAKHDLPLNANIVFSAQRDTEGHDEKSPKREKGPEALADFFIKRHQQDPNSLVLLAGWRRQYICGRLAAAGTPYVYRERPEQPVLNEFYQCADLYAVTSVHEGGPQAFLEAGAIGLPVVSTPVGIAEQVLHHSAIADDVSQAIPTIPDVERFKISKGGMEPYRKMFKDL